MNDIRNAGIVIAGAGNLAVNLALSLHKNGYRIRTVYNRTRAAGKSLAARTGAEFTDNLTVVPRDAGIIFLVVSDDAIMKTASGLKPGKALVVHCSGTTEINGFKGKAINYGVFNPVQTFLKARPSSMRNVPFCIEANSHRNEQILTGLALSLGGIPFILNSRQRMMVHLCSVLTSNFSNYLNSIAGDILTSHGISFDILLPLIRKTVKNAEKEGIFSRQTGPAMREDHEVIRKHLSLLRKHDDYANIYRTFTGSIIKYKNVYGKL